MKKLYIYMHTHWDREWYLPFESMRVHLLHVVRQIIKLVKSRDLPQFYLDGQSIILDDIAAVAPELTDEIAGLLQSGRLSAGPWYVLADQMLVAGESLIANLYYGIKTLKKFGEPSLIGYCPDTFGHSQDLPRILNGFGINNAVLWRGIPKINSSPLFVWQSPDNSSVTVYHLAKGYGQMSIHEYLNGNDEKKSNDLTNLANELAKWVDSNPPDKALYPAGFDHTMLPPGSQKLIDQLNDYYAKQKLDIEITPVNLADFLEKTTDKSTDKTKLDVIKGELRDNSAAALYERAYLLNGVLSARLYLKRENRESEKRLFRLCQPLLSLLHAAKILEYPADELEYANKLLLQNHPHDSICGCSVDSVHREMSIRSLRLQQILEALEDRAKQVIASNDSKKIISYRDPASNLNQLAAFNLSNNIYSGPIDFEWVGEVDAHPNKWDNSNIQIRNIIEKEELFSGWGQVPYYKKVKLIKGWINVQDIPALGEKIYDWPFAPAKEIERRSEVQGQSLSNGLLNVEINKDGNLLVKANGKQFLLQHIIRDIGDGGDTYNFDPIENDSYINAKLISTEPLQPGPLVASLSLKYEIDIPEKAVLLNQADIEQADNYEPLARSKNKIKHEITVEITLKKDVPILFFNTIWENKSSDHRLEIIFDTGEKINKTKAENHFSLVEHDHKNTDEKLPVSKGSEQSPDRFACQRFVVANNQVFFNSGLPEYGVDGSQLAITALRAVSWLSKADLRTRGGGAGPHIKTPEANCLGKNEISYGWAPLENNNEIESYSLVEKYENLLWATLAPKEKTKFISKSLIQIDNPAIKVMTIYTRIEPNKIFVRLLNTSMAQVKASMAVAFPYKYFELCSLDENNMADLGKQTIQMDFAVNELKTIAIAL